MNKTIGFLTRAASADTSLWARIFYAYALGGLMVLALPPIGFFPILLLCVPGICALTRHAQSGWRAFLTCWSFGAGYFIFGLYWVSMALLVDLQSWAWVLPLSLFVGPALLGIIYAFIPLLARRWRTDAALYSLAFICIWSIVEYARGHMMTGFPWNLPGYAWMHALPVVQIASVIGIYGLTLLTLLWAATPALWHVKILRVIALASFIACLAFGGVRLWQNPTQQNGDYTVRIVQANIPQTAKWEQDEQWRNLEKHALMSERTKPATFVIWPETAVTSDLEMFPEIAQYIGQRLPKNSIGILGALRMSEKETGGYDYYNGVVMLDPKANVLATYDKFHLVPFGEYIPFRDKISFTPLALALSGIGDFTAGNGNQTVRIDDLPAFSPLVCYEVIFPGAVSAFDDRPDFLVNVTNDGWYGISAGPYQHLEIARMRAVEEGLPLARAANTGVSAIIDALGRKVATQGLGSAGTLDSILPAPLAPTPYVKWGDILFSFLLVGLFIPLLRRKR